MNLQGLHAKLLMVHALMADVEAKKKHIRKKIYTHIYIISEAARFGSHNKRQTDKIIRRKHRITNEQSRDIIDWLTLLGSVECSVLFGSLGAS